MPGVDNIYTAVQAGEIRMLACWMHLAREPATIMAAKNELHSQMTWDPVTNQALNACALLMSCLNRLTVLCSLVKKDAGMLDAFGKGASDDIRAAKNELYSQMTWDPVSSQSLNAPPQITTPRPSPPPSPKLERVLSGNSDSNSVGAKLSCRSLNVLECVIIFLRDVKACRKMCKMPHRFSKLHMPVK